MCVFSHLVLSALCGPKYSTPPGSSVHGISQARILEWVTFPPSGDLPDPEIKLMSRISCFGRWILYH